MPRPAAPGAPESTFRGVSWDMQKGMWRSRIYVGNKQMSVGRFTCEVEAAQAYDCAALLIRAAGAGGKRADPRLNFGADAAAAQLPRFHGRVAFTRLRQKAAEAAQDGAASPPPTGRAGSRSRSNSGSPPASPRRPRSRGGAPPAAAAPAPAGSDCSGGAAASAAGGGAPPSPPAAGRDASETSAAAPLFCKASPFQHAALQLPDPIVSEMLSSFAVQRAQLQAQILEQLAAPLVSDDEWCPAAAGLTHAQAAAAAAPPCPGSPMSRAWSAPAAVTCAFGARAPGPPAASPLPDGGTRSACTGGTRESEACTFGFAPTGWPCACGGAPLGECACGGGFGAFGSFVGFAPAPPPAAAAVCDLDLLDTLDCLGDADMFDGASF
ncbi:MAG: hypothetical protein J3K34DRAFT_524377 [Monoraphidium minutum]|nr:MAG: hypothetical protein J3K34DRAFT_524377 [Monoraphidium minutum]